MGIVIVDVCSANQLTILDIETLLEKEFPEVAVVINQCLSYCGLCARSPFAHVNGKLIAGRTPEQCLEKIRQAIKKELAIYN